MLFPVAAAILCYIFKSIQAQNTQWDVIVGYNDTLVFNPVILSNVQVGDTVAFQFASKNHSVVQSTFTDPCTAAGLSSGFQAVTDSNGSALPVWSVSVLDNSSALWFFCSQTTDTATHCMEGMVFGINPTEQQSFAEFGQNARATLNTSPAAENPSGTTIPGILGASDATLSVVASPGALTSLPNQITSLPSETTAAAGSITTGLTTAAPTTTIAGPNSTSDKSPLPLGPIIGGVVGAIMIMIIVGIFIMLRMRRNRYRSEGVRKGGLKIFHSREGAEGLDSRDGPEHVLPRLEPTYIIDPFRLGPTDTINPFHDPIPLTPLKTASTPNLNDLLSLNTSPIRTKDRKHVVGMSDDLGDIRSPEQLEPLPQTLPNPETHVKVGEQSQQIPTSDSLQDQPTVPVLPGNLTAEEAALLRELRELQIVRRLEEIRGDQPPPEYE